MSPLSRASSSIDGGLDLAFDDGQQAIADAVAQFCADRCNDEVVKAAAGSFPAGLWRELAALGVLGAGTAEGEGGALEIVAAVESLGRAVFPGPLAATFLAMQLLPDRERADIAQGRSIVAAGTPPLLPFAPDADVFLEIDGERVYRARPLGDVEPVETLGGEPWGRLSLERVEQLPGALPALTLSTIVLAAQLAAAGRRLVDDASAHAATRTQFGKPIGDFQAVAHPLADCAIRLAASTELARAAAYRFDEGQPEEARVLAAAARLSASAASLEAVYVCHQVFGAIGITLEGPAFHVSRRIRQLASQPPGDAPARAVLLEHHGIDTTAAGEATS